MVSTKIIGIRREVNKNDHRSDSRSIGIVSHLGRFVQEVIHPVGKIQEWTLLFTPFFFRKKFYGYNETVVIFSKEDFL